jgi:hypothetical protein
MKLYIDNKTFEGTPEEILKVIDLIEGKKIEPKFTLKPITSPSTGTPPWQYPFPNTIMYNDGVCTMHNQLHCPVCK